LKEIVTSFVRHLHAFIREVNLTEEEWLTGIEFLTATGQMCDARRQEFILLSDTLGASTLKDLINNRSLGGDLGSDGSTPQGRASRAGFTGTVVQIVAINPALAINNVDVINQWYHDPRAFAIMSDCRYTLIGVSSENSLDRSVVVAVLGQPS
jgi:hypothetical protein